MTAGLEPGDRIGPYTVVGLLGAGSPGWVYLARTGAGRPMAVRALHGEQQGVKRAQKVRGPGVIEVVATGGAARSPWVASVYVPAPSLADLVISCGPLPADAVRWLAAGIAEGLATIHQASFVHGDLRPAQIVVASDGPRVTGFGIVGAGSALAAPGYLAPEQARGEDPTAASDMYGLGALLCFAATGRAPHAGEDEAAIRRGVATADPDLTGLPAELTDLVRSCLSGDPQERPTSRALLDELAPRLAKRQGAYGAASWLPAPALDLIDTYHRRGRLVGDPPTVSLADRVVEPAAPVVADAGGEAADSARPASEADAVPAPPRAAAETAAPPAAAEAGAETMQLAKVGEALIPRIDDSDDRHDGYDVYVPPAPHQAGAGWLLVASLVAIALVGGLLVGVAYQRGRGNDADSGGSSPSSRASSTAAGDPLAAFASTARTGACVDFATDGSAGWQPAAPRELPCEDPAARQRVLARTAAAGVAEDCMNTDGRSRWQPRPGSAALCLERVFHAGECVPADVRGDRQFAYLAYLVPCAGPLPKDRTARLRIDEIKPASAANTTGCPARSPVYYPLPSRGQELCMSTMS